MPEKASSTKGQFAANPQIKNPFFSAEVSLKPESNQPTNFPPATQNKISNPPEEIDFPFMENGYNLKKKTFLETYHNLKAFLKECSIKIDTFNTFHCDHSTGIVVTYKNGSEEESIIYTGDVYESKNLLP